MECDCFKPEAPKIIATRATADVNLLGQIHGTRKKIFSRTNKVILAIKFIVILQIMFIVVLLFKHTQKSILTYFIYNASNTEYASFKVF